MKFDKEAEYDFDSNRWVDNSTLTCYGGGGGSKKPPKPKYELRLMSPEEKYQQDMTKQAGVGQAITLGGEESKAKMEEYKQRYNEAISGAYARMKQSIDVWKGTVDAKNYESVTSPGDGQGLLSESYYAQKYNKPSSNVSDYYGLDSTWYKNVPVNQPAVDEQNREKRRLAVTDPVDMKGAGDITVAEDDKLLTRGQRGKSRTSLATGSDKTLKTSDTGLKI